jgi:Predicted metal binding domain
VHEELARAKFERDISTLTEQMAESKGLIVHERAYPFLDATILHKKNIRLRMHANDWDDLPPAIALLNPDATAIAGGLPGDVFNNGPHSATGKPFVCMRGAREYHTHSGHVNDKWDNYRGQSGMGLVGILMQLCSAWRRLVR